MGEKMESAVWAGEVLKIEFFWSVLFSQSEAGAYQFTLSSPHSMLIWDGIFLLLID